MLKLNRVKTADKIRDMVKDSAFSVTELAEMAGFGQQNIYQWQELVCLPSIEKLFKLAYALDCKVEDLIVMEES